MNAPWHLPRVLALRERDARDREGAYFVEGVRFVSAAFDAGTEVLTLVEARERMGHPIAQIVARKLRARGVPSLRVSAEEFRALSTAGAPQGIGVVVRRPEVALGRAPRSRDACWVAIDAVRSPGSLGTVLRTAAATGATGVIALRPDGGARSALDPLDPDVVRATMGAIFHLRTATATLDELGSYCAAQGASLVGVTPDGERDFRRVPLEGNTVLLLGAEREGLSVAQARACSVRVRIPMARRVDSLNLAVAASVMLYEVYRQRAPP